MLACTSDAVFKPYHKSNRRASRTSKADVLLGSQKKWKQNQAIILLEQDSSSWSGNVHCHCTFVYPCLSVALGRDTEFMHGDRLLGTPRYWSRMSQVPTHGPVRMVLLYNVASNGLSW